MSLVDENGRLLPLELCNIKTLESLTKYRAKSPSRHSPSRYAKKDPENARSLSPKLPTFVQDVINIESKEGSSIASPTAVRLDTNFIPKQGRYSLPLNGQREQSKDMHGASSIVSSGNGLLTQHSLNPDAKTKAKKMKSEDKTMQLDQLPKKHVSLWTTEDVCDWLSSIQLKHFEECFVRHGVTGKTLLNLNYETLDQLNISQSTDDREYFLAEVYKLQPKSEEMEEETDKEIQDTLSGDVLRSSYWNAESDVASSGSFASSSRTVSEHGHTPMSEIPGDRKDVKNNSQHGSQDMTTGQQLKPKTKKESQKYGRKKRKSHGKRISRFWSSLHGKNTTFLDGSTPPTIYKNAFHNLMNSGPQGVIKVWTEMFITDMQYVSLLVSHEATAFDVVKMVLEKSNRQEDPECYRICEVNQDDNEYVLGRDESPLQRERQWSDPDNCRFEIRWRNERLIEWRSGSVPQDLSLEKLDQESSVDDKNVESLRGENVAEEKESISLPQSPDSDRSQKPYLETAFDYNVEVEYRAKEEHEKLPISDAEKESTSEKRWSTNDAAVSEEVGDEIPRKADLRSDENSVKETEFLMVVSRRPEASSSDSSSGNSDEERVLASEEDDKKGATASDEETTASDEEATANDEEPTLTDEELEYSQQLRKSSIKLSGRLKLGRDNTGYAGHEVQKGLARTDSEQEHIPGMKEITGGDIGTHTESRDIGLPVEVTDHDRTHSMNAEGTPKERLIGIHSGTVGEIVEVKVLLGEQNGSQDDSCERSGDERFSEANASASSHEVNGLLERIKELENENLNLVEDNRELKKSCRTFEGKSRLKERELENLEEEKNDLAIQMQEMAADMHAIRTENTELRTSLAEADTKLSDVDGWITRDVFEDIRGQLSVSLEEVEKKEEEIHEFQKETKELREENERIGVLEMEVERLNEKIKEDDEDLEGAKRDVKDKLNQIRDLVAESEKLRGLVEEGEIEKQDIGKKLEEAENDVNNGKVKHAEEKKEFQKRLSDREYEVLIMKEEKKELCVKLKSLESSVDTLREELKKKDGEHEAVINEMKQQNEIKDESLCVTMSNLEQLVTERDQRIKELKKKIALAGAPESELQAKEHEYEQNKLYLKHLIAIVREKDPGLLDVLNRTLSSRDSDDWC